MTSQWSVMEQNLLLLPERSPDTLSFSDGARGLYGSSILNSAHSHGDMFISSIHEFCF